MPRLLLLSALCAALSASCAPRSADEAAEPAYFQTLNQELKAKGIGRPVIVLDLDRLDGNLDAMKASMGTSFRFRAVEKSLPSIELLDYILKRAGTGRVMAFHHPFFKLLLTQLPKDTDFLTGKPIPIEGVREVFAGLSPEQKRDAARRISWLVDSPQRLAQYGAFFKSEHLPFKVSVETDVGLHRGGARTLPEFDAILDAVRASSGAVTLAGLMGYDGHVASVPAPDVLGLKRYFMRRELNNVERRYRAFYEELKRYPELFAQASVFDGGGSETYALYRPDSVVDELAVGSAALMPKDFDGPTLTAHRPALFIAAPILRRISPARLPYVGRVSFNPHYDAFSVYGGGWVNDPEYPASLRAVPFETGTPNRNMVSNQTVLWGDPEKEAPGLDAGDFVFYRPAESDELYLFETILAVRGGKVVDTWHPFPTRY